VPTSSQQSSGSQAGPAVSSATGSVSPQLAALAGTSSGMGTGASDVSQKAGRSYDKSGQGQQQAKPAISEVSSFVTAESYGGGAEAASPEVTSMARPRDVPRGEPTGRREAGGQGSKAATMIDLTDSP
jgi:hypothetical protein